MKCNCGTCKSCYDKDRRQKIKNGTWKFYDPIPDHLTYEQEQVLIGGLLGDFHVYLYDHHITAGIAVGRAIKDLEYLKDNFNYFKDFCSDKIIYRNILNKKTGNTSNLCFFRTRCCQVFLDYRNKWYPDGKKIVPRDLVLTPLMLAIWFCDDGSVVQTNPNNKNKLCISLYTDGFLKEEVEYLASLINNELNINMKITMKTGRKPGYGFYLRTSNNSDVLKFIKYINPVFPKSMNRKSDRWKGLL